MDIPIIRQTLIFSYVHIVEQRSQRKLTHKCNQLKFGILKVFERRSYLLCLPGAFRESGLNFLIGFWDQRIGTNCLQLQPQAKCDHIFKGISVDLRYHEVQAVSEWDSPVCPTNGWEALSSAKRNCINASHYCILHTLWATFNAVRGHSLNRTGHAMRWPQKFVTKLNTSNQ